MRRRTQPLTDLRGHAVEVGAKLLLGLRHFEPRGDLRPDELPQLADREAGVVAAGHVVADGCVAAPARDTVGQRVTGDDGDDARVGGLAAGSRPLGERRLDPSLGEHRDLGHRACDVLAVADSAAGSDEVAAARPADGEAEQLIARRHGDVGRPPIERVAAARGRRRDLRGGEGPVLRDEVEHAVAPGAVCPATVVEVEHDDALGRGLRPDEPVIPRCRGLELPPDPVRARRRVLEAPENQ